MNYFIIKVKNQDLFFNADEVIGEYIHHTPLLLDIDQCENIMKYCPDEIYDMNDIMYHKSQLEIKKVKLEII